MGLERLIGNIYEGDSREWVTILLDEFDTDEDMVMVGVDVWESGLGC